jgi:hypothetical protein
MERHPIHQTLKERINEATAYELVGRAINARARLHIKNAVKGSCDCPVCCHRRKYVAAQESSVGNKPLRNILGSISYPRFDRKEIEKGLIKKFIKLI